MSTGTSWTGVALGLVAACSSSSVTSAPAHDAGRLPDATREASTRHEAGGEPDAVTATEAGHAALDAPVDAPVDAESGAPLDAPYDAFVGEKCTVAFQGFPFPAPASIDCELSVTASTSSEWQVVAKGVGFGTDAVDDAGDVWEGVSLYLSGSPMVGDAGDVIGGNSRVVGPVDGGPGLVYWYYAPGGDSGIDVGAVKLSLTSVGAAVDGGSDYAGVYPAAHGTIAITLLSTVTDGGSLGMTITF